MSRKNSDKNEQQCVFFLGTYDRLPLLLVVFIVTFFLFLETPDPEFDSSILSLTDIRSENLFISPELTQVNGKRIVD